MNSKKSKIKHKLVTRKNRSAVTAEAATKSEMQMRASNLKEKIQLGAAYISESVEKIGKKIQKSGYVKVGRAIEKMGNRVEPKVLFPS